MTDVQTGKLPTACDNWRSAQQFVSACLRDGKTVGVVMTMGALHQGHLSLVAAANAECDVTVVSIFVNPTQFAPEEDLEKYPRQLQADCELLSHHSVDLVFSPSTEQMYGDTCSTTINPPRVAVPWEGTCRPGHFAGVTTVVLKLMHILPGSAAYFGSKDYQQLAVIRAMVRDLNIPIRVVDCPIIRAPDGLALSSRNVYLSATERQQALALSEALSLAAHEYQAGQNAGSVLTQQVRQHLSAAGIEKVDYVALVDPVHLEEASHVDADTVALIAAYVGKTRLIDNRRLGDGPIMAS